MANHVTNLLICFDSQGLFDRDRFLEEYSDVNLCELCNACERGQELESWGTKLGTYGEITAEVFDGDCSPVVIGFASADVPPNVETRKAIMLHFRVRYGFRLLQWQLVDPKNDTIKTVSEMIV